MMINCDADMSIKQLIQITGCTRSRIDALVHNGKICRVGNCISKRDAERILRERETYISLPDFARSQSNDSFNGAVAKDREKMLDFLEVADFFGVEAIPAKQLLTGDMKERLYFRRDELPVLERGLIPFFKEFGMTEEEKVERLLKRSDKTETVFLLRLYIDNYMKDVSITPAFTDFIRRVLDTGKESSRLSDDEIVTLIKYAPFVATQDYIIGFLNYQRKKLDPSKVGFREIKREKKRSMGVPAYDNETYLQLAVCIFSPEHIQKNHMIEKALKNHIYAEMWLYLSLFFCCGSRAADITRVWQYPGLANRQEHFLGQRYCKKTLKEDLLMDRIPDEAYEIITKFALGMVDVNGRIPSKTSSDDPPVMPVLISKKMFTYFGLLTLIAETHMLETGEGYMRHNRTNRYQNKVAMREFFGPKISDALHGENIRATRLNKTLLQGVEHTGREMGYGGILTESIASYLRAHKDLGTIRSYLRDQKLTGETAEVVLYNMLDRGVFGFQLYQTLLAAYPDVLKKLPMAEQSQIMAMIKAGPMEIELLQSGVRTQYNIEKDFESGDTASVLRVLKSMFEITQGRGNAKDTGVYCKFRAQQELCRHPNWESCIENGCRDHIFTRHGIRALIAVVIKYRNRALAGDKKAEAVLKTIILPRFKEVLNQFMNETGMSRAERNALRIMAKEAYKDG